MVHQILPHIHQKDFDYFVEAFENQAINLIYFCLPKLYKKTIMGISKIKKSNNYNLHIKIRQRYTQMLIKHTILELN